jgi:hypothetical protein
MADPVEEFCVALRMPHNVPLSAPVTIRWTNSDDARPMIAAHHRASARMTSPDRSAGHGPSYTPLVTTW